MMPALTLNTMQAALQTAMERRTIHGLCRLALTIAPALATATVWAMPVEQIPNPRHIPGNWVSDVANILQPATEEKLNVLINQLNAANGSELAVVTLPDSTPFASPKELATTLFNTWGIGQKGKDNGLLFLISVGDRRVEIETGYGMEAILPDAKIGQLIQERITPKFKAGNFDAGIMSGTEALVKILQGENVELTSNHSWNFQPIEIWPVVVISGTTLALYFFFWAQRSNPNFSNNLLTSLQGLAGLVFVRGLGQSVKLNPRQSSRVNAWHLAFETGRSMRCASCGETLQPVDHASVETLLKPSQKAAESLGSLQCRGWRCGHCAPEAMHLRVYEFSSKQFAWCPHCQELTVKKEDPYIIREPSSPGRDLRVTNYQCVNCNYTNQVKELCPSWIAAGGSTWGGSSSSDGGGGGGDFSGGSSGGGGSGGDW